MKGFSKFASKITALISSLVLTCTITMTTVADAADTTETSRLLQCDHIVELSDGGKIYVYYIDGIENDFPVPPAGFKPIEASDEELATYGFPPRPDNEAELTEWNENMAAYKYTPIPQISQSDVIHGTYLPHFTDNHSNPKSLDQTTGSSNWSGYVSKGSFAMVQGDFTQPTIDPSNPSYTHESTWTGLGGYNSGKLVQTGTAMNTYAGNNHYYAWYEYLSPANPNPEIQFNSITVNPGDNIHTYCSFQQANNLFNAYVANNTNGTSQSVLVNISASEYFDSGTAEFINEKPSWGVTDNGLTKYGTTYWWNCQAYTMSCVWQSLGSTTYDKVIMYNTSGAKRAEPTAVNGQSFTSVWYNY